MPQYINRVRANIHIVLCMSPLGEAFRTRLRMFPSIVNCCTIDWFMEWPDEVRELRFRRTRYFVRGMRLRDSVHRTSITMNDSIID